MNIIEQKAKEIASKHAEIIEYECKLACMKFNCRPEDLIIEYIGRTQIKINVKASHFEITNVFTCDSGEVRHDFQNIDFK